MNRFKLLHPLASLLLIICGMVANLGAAQASLLITHPRLTRSLEDRGFSLSAILKSDAKQLSESNEILASAAPFNQVIASIASRLKLMTAKDPLLGVGMVKNHRLFDLEFLKSPNARFALVGVVNRMDRAYLDPAACGEVRLIYRLAYRVQYAGEDVSSRLPMTLNLVFKAKANEQETCVELAQKWEALEALDKSVSDLDTHPENSAGPILNEMTKAGAALDVNRFQAKTLIQLETNLQATRWPSAIKPDFGGYSEYLLQVFQYDANANQFRPSLLENQLDVEKLQANPGLKAKLKAWISRAETLKSIDQGTLNVPNEYLADFAISISPGGTTRLQNRPSLRLFSRTEWSSLNLNQMKRITTATSLLRKIDDQSCTGCHQVRNMAGFHLMGRDPALKYPGNSVFVPGSPHLFSDQLRRKSIVHQFANGATPSFDRGFSARPDDSEAISKWQNTGLLNGWGASCSLGKDSALKTWTCASGLACQGIIQSAIEQEVGLCLPLPSRLQIGDPCEQGVTKNALNPHEDTHLSAKREGLVHGSLICSAEKGGFPDGGMSSMLDCSAVPKEGVCGVLPTAKPGFNTCIGTGRAYVACLREFASPRALRACDSENPCRDDWICAEAPNQALKGACVPPYFLFQFRVDGHPVGTGTK